MTPARLHLALSVVALTVGRVGAEPPAWPTATPESQGMAGDRLAALKDELARRKTRAFVVVRNDRLVYEWYAPGTDPAKPQGTASLAKALVGGLPLAVALGDGRIALDDPVWKYVPAWKDDPRKARVTVRHLGSHTSGLDDAEADGLSHDKLTGWKGDFWKRRPPPDDPFTLARDRAAVRFDPGERLRYSNPGIAMLTYCVTAALKGTADTSARDLLRVRVMKPLGVADADWSVGYGQTTVVDGLSLVPAWGGAAFTLRATARIGQLLLHGGEWDGRRILTREAVRQVTGDAGLPGHCGMGFWTNADGRYPKLPRDTYYGAGAGDQLLIVIPSLNLVAVRNGDALAPPKASADVFEAYHDERVRILFEPLVAAVTAAP